MQEAAIKDSFVRSPIEVRLSSIHRYGVFATRDIFSGELIEECLVLTTKRETLDKLGEMGNRMFYWNDIEVAMSLGFGSIYNHSDTPNAEFYQTRSDRIIKFVAIKPIGAGSEILIDYRNNAWFVRGGKDAIVQAEEKEAPKTAAGGYGNSGANKIFIFLFSLLVLSLVFSTH